MFVFLALSTLYPNNRLRRLQALLPLKSVLLKSGMVQGYSAIVFPPTGPVQLMTKHPITILKFMQNPPIHIHLPTPLYRVPLAHFKWSGQVALFDNKHFFLFRSVCMHSSGMALAMSEKSGRAKS